MTEETSTTRKQTDFAELLPELHAGDIGAVVKLRETHTGHTLCSPRFVVTLPKVEYPHPNIHGALKLRSKGDEDKLATGLATLHAEDPTDESGG